MLNSKPEIIESLEKELSFLKELLDDAILHKDFLEAHRIQTAIIYNQKKLNKLRRLLIPNYHRNQALERSKLTLEKAKNRWHRVQKILKRKDVKMPSDEEFEKEILAHSKKLLKSYDKMIPLMPDFQVDSQIFEELMESLIQNEISTFILWLSEKRREKIHFSIQEKTLFVEVFLGEQKLKSKNPQKMGFIEIEEGKLLYKCRIQQLTDTADLKQRVSVLIFNEFDEIDVDTYFEVF